MLSTPCPVSSSDIDVIPESYHYLNRCICFMCTCGLHKCPSASKTLKTSKPSKSSYKRSYSKPLVSSHPYRVSSTYKENTTKMDLKTTYMREFTSKDSHSKSTARWPTPQPGYKFEGKSQYSRDFPNWGPVSYVHNKRPVHPIHETKIEFKAKSSYSNDFSQKMRKDEKLPIQKSIDGIKGLFQAPIVSTSQREYKAAADEYLVSYSKKEADAYIPTVYNPHQFNTTFRTNYVNQSLTFKDPLVVRRGELAKKNIN